MRDRTINIILLTKRFGSPNRVKKAIAKYMSEECNCPIEVYTDEVLLGIIRSVIYDFLYNASRRSDTIRFVRELIESRYSAIIDKAIIALAMIQVCQKDGLEYHNINGWHETEFTKKLDNEEWSI